MGIAKLFLAALAYGVVTVALFGDPAQPIGLATFWSDRLGIPYWRQVAAICVAISALVFALPRKGKIFDLLRWPIFTVLAVILPTLSVGIYADRIRHQGILVLVPDSVDENSFFKSIRKAPADFQSFLHTAAIKDCKPYAWSYRRLAFYEVPPNVAVNVLPLAWINRCGIVRSDRY